MSLAKKASGLVSPSFSQYTFVRLTQLGIVGIGLLIWELLPGLEAVDASLLPPFSTVIEQLIVLILEEGLLSDLFITFGRVLVAFFFAVIIAVPAGLILGAKSDLGDTIGPFVNFLIAVPQSIFLPLFIFALGTGNLQKIVFGITHGIFVIAINTMAGIQSVDEELELTVRSYGASDRQLFRHVYLPASIPMVLTGLRYGMIFVTVGVLIAEEYVSRGGIGKLLIEWGNTLRYPSLFAGILIIGVTTIIINEIIREAERRANQWKL